MSGFIYYALFIKFERMLLCHFERSPPAAPGERSREISKNEMSSRVFGTRHDKFSSN